jgi:Fe2+ or Zn2+ uptake regulation protein
MVDVDCAVGETPCLTPADGSGYEVDEAEVVYWGRCPECVAATTNDEQSNQREEHDRRE